MAEQNTLNDGFEDFFGFLKYYELLFRFFTTSGGSKIRKYHFFVRMKLGRLFRKDILDKRSEGIQGESKQGSSLSLQSFFYTN